MTLALKPWLDYSSPPYLHATISVAYMHEAHLCYLNHSQVQSVWTTVESHTCNNVLFTLHMGTKQLELQNQYYLTLGTAVWEHIRTTL